MSNKIKRLVKEILVTPFGLITLVVFGGIFVLRSDSATIFIFIVQISLVVSLIICIPYFVLKFVLPSMVFESRKLRLFYGTINLILLVLLSVVLLTR